MATSRSPTSGSPRSRSGGDGLLHTFCGTPTYVAPEVLSRRGYDGAKVDIWSYDVILFILTAGCLLFCDCNIVSIYRKIYKGDLRCPRWFSADLKRLLHRLLDTNPRTRITISEIMEDNWFKKDVRTERNLGIYLRNCLRSHKC
ncbi:hypothetical protein ZIOFF_000367 [Zingiber officinale]|uniref:Protein kinase domain-containing protein n=1 Tax=Zingiber officinale TaxID=94328 RepID=A0A8J5IHM0_ZINOF|nr:hypothetical protein ZIOFF_000367 [Zingiber officinale]